MLLDTLRKHTRLSATKLERYAETASRRYKVYEIPKKTGGTRVIEHPSREIKAIQRWLNQILIRKLSVHPCATAYKKGASIRDNALRHARTNFTLRVDFEEFFPSFSDRNVLLFLNSRARLVEASLSQTDVEFFTKIVCRNGRLTIGAPSSPPLTNAMMYEFDHRLSLFCESKGLIYTRYADDIFISANEPGSLREAFARIEEYASQHPFAKLRINKGKTAYLSKKYKRTITGLVITPQRKVSIGKYRKDQIKTDIYKYCKGVFPIEKLSQLQGNVAFVKDSEPEFFSNLVRKYGQVQIDRISKGEGKHLGFSQAIAS